MLLAVAVTAGGSLLAEITAMGNVKMTMIVPIVVRQKGKNVFVRACPLPVTMSVPPLVTPMKIALLKDLSVATAFVAPDKAVAVAAAVLAAPAILTDSRSLQLKHPIHQNSSFHFSS